MRDDHGQMHIDYLIGIAIFLTSIIFVFSYTAGLFTPFQSNSDEVTLIADRIATNLIEQNMSAESIRTPNMLSSTKVDDFFNNSGDYESIIDYHGMNSSYLRYELNVTLENIGTGPMSLDYSTGKTLPVQGNVGQTKRIVIVRNDDTGDETLGILAVRVW
ncbi:hypothetical protein [Methanolobus vulcani]|uniref:Uncharacterized protein n=1 Tax=Methanolobus vulcani TaxID=38026 RepID=A0A7Z8KQI4_9EURY|nr:hypothetical protein [Methanolobus vulcani]TQD28247.1 hypothetical protein FKV42_00830 [Methanolobus vulcani]